VQLPGLQDKFVNDACTRECVECRRGTRADKLDGSFSAHVRSKWCTLEMQAAYKVSTISVDRIKISSGSRTKLNKDPEELASRARSERNPAIDRRSVILIAESSTRWPARSPLGLKVVVVVP